MTLEAIKALALLTIALGIYLGLINDPRANKGHTRTEITIIIIGDSTMPFDIASIIGGLVAGAGDWGASRQQFTDQLRLMQRQQEIAKDMAIFNQQLGLDTWEKTGYGAQAEQMRKAGLNVGLMYKGGGGAGTTQTTAGQMPGAGSAPRANPGMALQMAMQMEMQKAQIENVKADTDQKRAQIPKTQAETSQIEANTHNTKLDTELKNLDISLKRVQTGIAQGTEQDVIKQIQAEAERAVQTAKIASNQNEIATQTKEDVIKQVSLATTEAQLRIDMQRAGLIKIGVDMQETSARIKEIAHKIVNMDIVQRQDWTKLNIEAQQTGIRMLEADLKDIQTSFNTSTPEQIKQWTSILTNAVHFVAGLRR